MENWIEDGPVTLTFADGVAKLTLNRPDVANGMNLEMMQAIHAALQEAEHHRRQVLMQPMEHLLAEGARNDSA